MHEYIYSKPDMNFSEDGHRDIIIKLCFGPIESIVYGITEDAQFYCEYTFPTCLGDDELETHFKYISKETFLNVLSREISDCKDDGNIEMLEILSKEKDKLFND